MKTLSFQIESIERDCDGAYGYWKTIKIGLIARASGPCCDAHNGGYMPAETMFFTPSLGARINLNNGDFEAGDLIFLIDDSLYSTPSSLPIDGKESAPRYPLYSAQMRFAKVLTAS